MYKTLPLIECSIDQLYLESCEPKTYMIPIYQRNYAWEEDEITALIKDVYDSLAKNPMGIYYIGTLVTYKRGDNVYEVIDGQQRLTTIYIILKALGEKDISNKLTYGARRASASTIQKLDNYPDLGEEVDNGIWNGYKYAEKALITLIDSRQREEFRSYFLHNVHIIHYNVPKDVDLNHYFEIMNSRGEQLEKHEIVKSMLSHYLKDKNEVATFSRVWEACSEMNVYIQNAFPNVEVFGSQLSEFMIKDFEHIPAQDESQGKETLLNLLKRPITKFEDNSKDNQNDKFQPIIDFPNFLLIVLKLTRMQYENFDPADFSLDDKELLNEFNNALRDVNDSEQAGFVRRFAFNLLKAKFLLDNYIVHHDLSEKEQFGDNPWKLQYFYRETPKKYYPKNLSKTQEVQKELVHLLSMFEVSFTPKQRKNYLFYCMMYLFSVNEPKENEYLDFLQRLARKYFYNVYLSRSCLNERNQPGPNAFDNAMLAGSNLNLDLVNEGDYKDIFVDVYKVGSMDIPLYVFNYTDYILWKKYADELRGEKIKKGSKERNRFFEELGCSDFELDSFNNFYFSRTRKSLEHYYPQAKSGDNKLITLKDINRFGNFAMISAEANSSGSNWDPKQKLDHYNDGKTNPVSVASLKFKIMMRMCQDNHKSMLNGDLDRSKGMEWNVEDMKKHQEKMLDIMLQLQ